VDLEANVDEFMHREINYMPWPHPLFFFSLFSRARKDLWQDLTCWD
jgi:hypothetical protein